MPGPSLGTRPWPRTDLPQAKVCLVGERLVGKTSLLRRYLYGAFDDSYVATLGARVHQSVALSLEDGEPGVQLVLWDLMGDPGFRELLQEAYFHGTLALLAVCDVTRRTTLWSLGTWFRAVARVASPPVILVVGNKADLGEERVVTFAELEEFAAVHGAEALEASARTGEGVAEAFATLVTRLRATLPRVRPDGREAQAERSP